MNFKDTEGKLKTHLLVVAKSEKCAVQVKKQAPQTFSFYFEINWQQYALTYLWYHLLVCFLFVNVNHNVNANKLHRSAAQQQRKYTENMKKIIH